MTTGHVQTHPPPSRGHVVAGNELPEGRAQRTVDAVNQRAVRAFPGRFDPARPKEEPETVMSDRDAFERSMASLYDAMLDDTRWPVASALIDEACGLTGNGLVVGDPADSEGWGSSRIAMITGLLPHIRQFVRVRQVLEPGAPDLVRLEQYSERVYRVLWSLSDTSGGELRRPTAGPAPAGPSGAPRLTAGAVPDADMIRAAADALGVDIVLRRRRAGGQS